MRLLFDALRAEVGSRKERMSKVTTLQKVCFPPCSSQLQKARQMLTLCVSVCVCVGSAGDSAAGGS